MALGEDNEEGTSAENRDQMALDEETKRQPTESIDTNRVDSSPDSGVKQDIPSDQSQGHNKQLQDVQVHSKDPTDENASKASKPVPRQERRGLFSHFTLVAELENSSDYSNSIKWLMTAIVALAATTSSAGSSISYPALADMAVDLNTSATVANLSLALYILAMAFAPMWWQVNPIPRRRTTYIVSFTLFVVFACISAVSVNITMLIIFRILSGGAAASVQSVGAGTVADLWPPKQRGHAMGIFYIGPLCGPALAPIIGGALTQGLGWRSTMWALCIFGGVNLIMIFVCLPETLSRSKLPPPSLVRERQEQQQTERPVTESSVTSSIGRILLRIIGPLLLLKYLRHLPILISVFSAAMAFSALYVVNISIQAEFPKAPYHFTTIEVGLLYIAPTLGYAVASILGGKWIDRIMAREAIKAGRYDADGKPVYLPEDRMRENIWLAASLYPAGMIWYGWSVQERLPWIVCGIACFFFGLGSMLVLGCVTTMLTEFTPRQASTGIAIITFVRNIFSVVATVVTEPLIDAMGSGWLMTMVGLLAWITGNAAILALRKWGPHWRVNMDRKLNPQK
ncbi:hypothetical protein THARTR1_08105 [Trichoderma harzianum]|uniref:Major facilitator superfamily (MFS) profile domain-containing protein n=1 Tax=Trichoderma harzianum TaxID=5544 RepID=A0A2K0U0B4_TRIHA|nr:hypothetical protein THARTR1_08105 [Trichoderma harzianum]